MALIRTILAALIAISVAVLPATGEAIALPSGDQLAMADQADMPCCPCCNTQADLKLTTCALKCIAVVGAVFPATVITPLYLVDGLPLPFIDDLLHGFLKAPPTHPPSA
jgi:hypothetical protein